MFAIGLLLTTGSLALLGVLAPGVHTAVEVAVIVAANLVATVVRFVLFRSWVFRRPGSPVRSSSGAEIPA